MMDDKHPLQELAGDPQFAEAMQNTLRLGIRFDEMITTLQTLTYQTKAEAIRDLENAMGALIVREMRKNENRRTPETNR